MTTMPARSSDRQGEVSRVTRSGRKITYSLKVIQQPERARACGSGAKSSADRRPVDPPPVVELRIFEGEGPEKEDITFGYEANFFLFASLELARPMAHSRNHPAPQQPPPVLTGMPVSGMAYLDRPAEAGYFIFPDLSVRHEGRYKLAFNLYEQTKKDHDLDAEPSPESQQSAPNGPHAADSSFDFRMEVKSSTFHVWSAKKFPGLKESTALSRTVAEQGCRVRIRRDVRMRRRGDGKGSGDYEDPAFEDQYARGRHEEDRTSRSRSTSLASSGSPSMRANGSQPLYQSQPGNHLGFIPGAPSSQFPAPSQHFAPPQPPAPARQQPAPPQYQQPPPPQLYAQPPPPPPPAASTTAPHAYAYERPSYPPSAYPTNPPRETIEPEARRPSAPYPPPSTYPREFPPVDAGYNRTSQHQYPSRPHNTLPPSPVTIAPIKMSPPPIEPRYNASLPSVLPYIAPEHPSPSRDRSGSYSSYPTEPVRAGGKRSFDSVFKSSASTQPLYNGMRPSTHIDAAFDDDDDDGDSYSLEALRKMSYKRADGNVTSRDIPQKIYGKM